MAQNCVAMQLIESPHGNILNLHQKISRNEEEEKKEEKNTHHNQTDISIRHRHGMGHVEGIYVYVVVGWFALNVFIFVSVRFPFFKWLETAAKRSLAFCTLLLTVLYCVLACLLACLLTLACTSPHYYYYYYYYSR